MSRPSSGWGLDGFEAPLLICNEDHRFIVAEQMRQIGIEPSAILLEPMGRNTAPAVTAQPCRRRGGRTLADRAGGRPPDPRCETVPPGRMPVEPLRGRSSGDLGIVPTAPETGYVTSKPPNPSAGRPGDVPIARFVEAGSGHR